MADVFSDYARYYNLLYKDKDYKAEAVYVQSLIHKYKPGTKTILNLGCGTGQHDRCLYRMGYHVCGVDLSQTMLVEARKHAVAGKLEFFHGDVRNFDLGKTFDAVISLFHVMSYQTGNKDILSAFRTAAQHLEAGGVFVFDFWHAQGVLDDPPQERVRCLEDASVKIIRTARPVVHPQMDVIDVNYHMQVTDKLSGAESELRETHSMRYFFLRDLERFLSQSGFRLMDCLAWFTNNPLKNEWYGVVVACKQEHS